MISILYKFGCDTLSKRDILLPTRNDAIPCLLYLTSTYNYKNIDYRSTQKTQLINQKINIRNPKLNHFHLFYFKHV